MLLLPMRRTGLLVWVGPLDCDSMKVGYGLMMTEKLSCLSLSLSIGYPLTDAHTHAHTHLPIYTQTSGSLRSATCLKCWRPVSPCSGAETTTQAGLRLGRSDRSDDAQIGMSGRERSATRRSSTAATPGASSTDHHRHRTPRYPAQQASGAPGLTWLIRKPFFNAKRKKWAYL